MSTQMLSKLYFNPSCSTACFAGGQFWHFSLVTSRTTVPVPRSFKYTSKSSELRIANALVVIVRVHACARVCACVRVCTSSMDRVGSLLAALTLLKRDVRAVAEIDTHAVFLHATFRLRKETGFAFAAILLFVKILATAAIAVGQSKSGFFLIGYGLKAKLVGLVFATYLVQYLVFSEPAVAGLLNVVAILTFVTSLVLGVCKELRRNSLEMASGRSSILLFFDKHTRLFCTATCLHVWGFGGSCFLALLAAFSPRRGGNRYETEERLNESDALLCVSCLLLSLLSVSPLSYGRTFQPAKSALTSVSSLVQRLKERKKAAGKKKAF